MPQVAVQPAITDPAALLRHLDVSGHFHRDSRAGRAYHRGTVSLRENVSHDSLHVAVDDNRLTAHVDRVSPLAAPSEGPSGYAAGRAVAHNLSGMAQDVVRLLRGRLGDHGCELNCEWVQAAQPPAPRSSSGVQLEARVAGAFDEARLRSALGVAFGPRTAAHDLLEVVDCHDDDALDSARARLQSTPVAVDQWPPLRTCLARHRAGDVLMLTLNHAASDGRGALWVLRAVARAYVGDAAEPLDFLATRDLPVRPMTGRASAPARAATRLTERLRNLLARPARLAGDQAGDEAGYGFHLFALAAAETGRVKAGTRVLTTALHLTIGDWNQRHGADAGRVAVLVAVDLRSADWDEETIGNFSVTARLATSARDRSEPASALRAISDQAERNARDRTGIALIAGLRRAGLLALWAKQSAVVLEPLTANRSLDAAMLCDLGRLEEAPSFGPDAGETVQLWFSTPVRSAISLSLGAVVVKQRLHLTLRYPRRLFSAAAANRFCECYVDHLRRVAAGGASSDEHGFWK